jgi:hypothetical protein
MKSIKARFAPGLVVFEVEFAADYFFGSAGAGVPKLNSGL